jgi:hypothetical protein
MDPSGEQRQVPELLDQHIEVFGVQAPQVALDGGYHDIGTLQEFVRREIDVLCPENARRLEEPQHSVLDEMTSETQTLVAALGEQVGSTPAQTESGKSGKKKLPLFHKRSFTYDEGRDEYICPAGRRLSKRQENEENGRRYRKYIGTSCADCPLQARCKKGKGPRTLRRYEGEELLDDMKEIMKHPQARAVFAKRKAVAEPPQGVIKGPQRLSRFGRRGKAGAALEWSWHCQAYNLKKALSLRAKARQRADGDGSINSSRRTVRRRIAPAHWSRMARHRRWYIVPTFRRLASSN